MAVFSIVKLSELEGVKRLDAEYYKPEYLKVKQKLLQTKFVYFKDLVKEIIHPKEIKREYEEEKQDYLFLLAQNVRPLMLDLSEKKFISEGIAKLMPKNLLEKGDILFVRSGNVGDLTIYTGEPNRCIASADLLVAKIIFRHPYYIGVFLNTFWGRKILLRGIYSGLQPHIAPNYIKQIPIPIFSEDFMTNIDNLFLQAQDLLKQSQNLYSQAETLLLEELGLKDLKPKYEKTYTAKLSDAFSAHRIDAEYFQPAYEEVVRKIREYPNGFSKLLKHVENIKPNFDPAKYPDKDFFYVELADIDSSIGIIHSVNKVKGGEAPSRARRLLEEGDVIVSGVEGSLEKVALVDKEHDGCLASTGFFQFRPSLGILPEVLLVLSKTIVLQSQLKKKCSGTILTAVPKESLRDIIIPLLSFSTQQEIASLVRKSHEARKKAKELLEVAKKAVEIAIENNEKEALDYISKKEEK
jgi:restriction endonuclease S subunit